MCLSVPSQILGKIEILAKASLIIFRHKSDESLSSIYTLRKNVSKAKYLFFIK